MTIVLDASVFVATLSPVERHHAVAMALYALRPPDESFLVPGVFRLEILAALTRKGAPEALIDTADAQVRGPAFRSVPVSGALLDDAGTLARATGLRAYDALYAALAWRREATLLTLDQDVLRRLSDRDPALDVRCEP